MKKLPTAVAVLLCLSQPGDKLSLIITRRGATIELTATAK